MGTKLLHIFRNTPLGRETFLQSTYLCKKLGTSLDVYIPEFSKFLMYFENDAVQVDLDASYLTSPETAKAHVKEILKKVDLSARYITPNNFTASTLPDIPVDYDFMCCPRSISDMSSKIGLGYIGSRVRRIVKSARFPVLITSPVYKEWKSVAVLFGGSSNALKALKLGIRISREAGMRLDIFTQIEKKCSKTDCEKILKENKLDKYLERHKANWVFFEKGKFEENLYDIPHDALVVVGAYGHSVIKDILFGSKMERIQSTVSNNLLVVGPNYFLKS